MGKTFKDFEIYKNFKNKDKEKIYLYLSAMYDQKSPLNAIQDLGEKKLEAALKSGLNPKDSYVKDIMDLKDKAFEELLFHYLSYYQFNNRFQLLITKQQLFWSMQRVMNRPLNEDEEDEEVMRKKLNARYAISNDAKSLIDEIEYLKSEIYGTDDVKKMAEMHVRKMLTLETRLKQA